MKNYVFCSSGLANYVLQQVFINFLFILKYCSAKIIIFVIFGHAHRQLLEARPARPSSPAHQLGCRYKINPDLYRHVL